MPIKLFHALADDATTRRRVRGPAATGRNATPKTPRARPARTQGPGHSFVIAVRAGKTPAAADANLAGETAAGSKQEFAEGDTDAGIEKCPRALARLWHRGGNYSNG